MAIDFGNYAKSYAGGTTQAGSDMFKGIVEGISKLPTREDKVNQYDNMFFQKQFSGLGGKFDLSTGNYLSLEENPNFRSGLGGKGNFIYQPKTINGQPNPEYKGPGTKKLDKFGQPMRHSRYTSKSGFSFKSKQEALQEYLAGMRKKYGPLFAKKMGNPLLFSEKYDKFTQNAAAQLKQQILTLKASSPTWSNKKLYDAINNNPGMMQFMKQNAMFTDPELAPLLGPHTYWGDPETSMFGQFDYGKGILPTGIPGLSGDPNYMMSDAVKIAAGGVAAYMIGSGLYKNWNWVADKMNPGMGTATSPDGKKTVRITRPDRLIPANVGPRKPLPKSRQIPPIPDSIRFPGGGTPPVVSGPPGIGRNIPGHPVIEGPPVKRGMKDVERFGSLQDRQTLKYLKEAKKIPLQRELVFGGKKIPKEDLTRVAINKNGNIVKYKPGKIRPDYQIIDVPKNVVNNPVTWRKFLKENFGTIKGWKNLVKGGLQYTAASYGGGAVGEFLATQAGSTQPGKWGEVGQRAGRTGMDVYFTNKMIQNVTGQSIPQVTKTALKSAKSSLPKMVSMFGKIYKDRGAAWILKHAVTKAPFAAARLGLKGLVGAAGSPTGVITAAMAAWSAYDAYQLLNALVDAYQAEGGDKGTTKEFEARGRRPRLVSPGNEYKAGSGDWLKDMKAWREGRGNRKWTETYDEQGNLKQIKQVTPGVVSPRHGKQFEDYLGRTGSDWHTFFKNRK